MKKDNSFHHWFTRFRELIDLIRAENTGTAEDLAKELNVSRRAVFRYLDVLRDRYSPVHYCKKRRTYYFEKEVVLLRGLLDRKPVE